LAYYVGNYPNALGKKTWRFSKIPMFGEPKYSFCKATACLMVEITKQISAYKRTEICILKFMNSSFPTKTKYYIII